MQKFKNFHKNKKLLQKIEQKGIWFPTPTSTSHSIFLGNQGATTNNKTGKMQNKTKHTKVLKKTCIYAT